LDLGFIIDDLKEMDVFYSMIDIHFGDFIQKIMDRRIEAKLAHKKGLEQTYKMCLNASYGKDGMNPAKFSNTYILNKNKTLYYQTKPNHVATRKINDDLYLVQMSKTNYSIKTPLQCACACLDNTKYWIMNTYYNAFSKFLNMKWLQVVYMDTDSFFMAISGDPTLGMNQGIDAIIKDQAEYERIAYTLFPDPTIENPLLRIKDEKKLLGLAIEKYGNIFYGVSPKSYYMNCWEDENSPQQLRKMKGVSRKYNEILEEQYADVINKNSVVYGVNYQLKLNALGPLPFQMMSIKQRKAALTPLHNKMRVLSNQSCAPLIEKLTRADYIVVLE
jgi:hypothetical protein